MADTNETIKITVEQDGEKVTSETPINGELKIVIIINNQFTSAPNTTQLASGAGHSSAAGSNAAIDSANTQQQQSVGAQGRAENSGQNGEQSEPHGSHGPDMDEKELVIVINNQANKTPQVSPQPGQQQPSSSATQVASGGGNDSAAGTNAALESSNTKQQQGVGGAEGGTADNSGQDDAQLEQEAAEVRLQSLEEHGRKRRAGRRSHRRAKGD
ncbi:MAG TPA: hypothetical protein VGK74_25605 [Symbiobacteriaceae bacterium]